jgi:hypothetical protein
MARATMIIPAIHPVMRVMSLSVRVYFFFIGRTQNYQPGGCFVSPKKPTFSSFRPNQFIFAGIA